MSMMTQLIGFGLRQVIGDFGDNVVQVVEVVEQRFRDHSGTLPKALEQSHGRAWQALEFALAGDGLIDRLRVAVGSGDNKGVREQVQLFLKSNAFSFAGSPAAFRQTCLDEMKRLRKSGRLALRDGAAVEIAQQAAGFRRYADAAGLVAEAHRAVAGVADGLADVCPNLAILLRTPTPNGPPLLAAAFCYFFRREVETNDELAHGLFFDGLRQLSASQARAFGEVGKALDGLGARFDQAIDDVLEELERTRIAVERAASAADATKGIALDIQAEMRQAAPTKCEPNAPQRLQPVELWDLVSAFARLMRETMTQQTHDVVVDQTPLHVYMGAILDRLRAQGRLPFAALFTPPHTRGRLVGLFLGVLELTKQRRIVPEQGEPFTEIWVSLAVEPPA